MSRLAHIPAKPQDIADAKTALKDPANIFIDPDAWLSLSSDGTMIQAWIRLPSRQSDEEEPVKKRGRK